MVFEWELDRRETPLDCPIVATLLTVFTSGVSYSSKTTPRALSSATSASISCVVQVICVWVPLAELGEGNNRNRVPPPQR